MNKMATALAAIAVSFAASDALAQQRTQSNNMSFFVTSAGSGKGADLGGLQGADALCQRLAQSAGAGNRNWRAYLSADAAGNQPAMNARDRIGNGPWTNAKGAQIASNRANLHSDQNNLTKETALTEKGQVVNGSGDRPNMHDILTGSQADGTLATGQTCNNWTSSGEGTTIVGHHDRRGTPPGPTAGSWNASHPTRGCSQEALVGTGGNGLFYCFAAR
jgi:hypothetical protein